MKKRSLARLPLRWFLLLWIGMAVAAWLVGNITGNTVSGGLQIAVSSDSRTFIDAVPVGAAKPTLPLSLTLLFLLLAALYSFLLWRGLSGQVSPRFFWLYFLVQWLLLFAMYLVAGHPTLTLNFSLAPTPGGLALSKPAGPSLLAARRSPLLSLAP